MSFASASHGHSWFCLSRIQEMVFFLALSVLLSANKKSGARCLVSSFRVCSSIFYVNFAYFTLFQRPHIQVVLRKRSSVPQNIMHYNDSNIIFQNMESIPEFTALICNCLPAHRTVEGLYYFSSFL